MSIELKKRIKKHVSEVKSAQDIFDLFQLLNYPDNVFYDTSYKRDIGDFNFRKQDSDRITQIYSILNYNENLPVFLLETTSLAPSFIRSVATKFDSQYLRFLIILTDESYSEMVFVLPDREKVEDGKYRLKITKLVINKEDLKERNEYYTVIDTLAKIKFENEPNWRDVWFKWKESFDVDKVTTAFFEDYKKIFFKLRKSIQTSLVSPKGAHEYTLQFLNRVMFIYFISKKGWLKSPKFINWFWTKYKEQNNYGSNEFHSKWLNQVFFKGFNNRGHEINDLPQDIKEVIMSFPYLNGGLFKENKIDTCPVKIKDEMFQKIFEFFEKYNFTIKEDMPFESEVAVDPQMIGYVYETLASLSSKDVDIYTESEKKEDSESRKKWGIFYTPIIEVDFMCRRSLVEYISNYLPHLPKEHIYHFVFDPLGEFEETEHYLTHEKKWDQIEDTLDNLSIVDPACGSGAFLVGMMNVLGELYGKVYKHTDTNLDDYQMKYRIIQRSLYGVDVMKWAVDAAELRLWLQLIIETNIKGEELRKSPLLPNLNLNLRVGDSLVQEIGGINFNVRSNEIDSKLKKKLEELKREKATYFENPQRAKYKSIKDFHKQELKLFNSIINSRIKILQDVNEIKQKRTQTKQITLGAKTKNQAKKFDDKTNKKILREIKENKTQIQNLRKMKKALKNSDQKPFVWEIDFAEIFGDKNGFDIVIGNPPYIMHEKISPPNKIKSERLKKYKLDYKSKLIKSSKNLFPSIKKIDGKSDYYLYFFFHGLGLLNEKGVFCFITSNSWLDAKYGASLQEFLLNKVPIIAIYDNIKKRSFAHADINTVISLFGNPMISYSSGELKSEEDVGIKIHDNTAKFVIFKQPYENVINSNNLIEIEKIKSDKGNELKNLLKNLVDKSNFKVFPIAQKDLLHDGWIYPENYDYSRGRFKAGSYNGNKWNSKFLRAPRIFYTILKKGKFKNLETFGHIETYLNTGGADKFYFVDLIKRGNKYSEIKNKEFNEKFKIETKYIKPMIKSPQELSKILVQNKDLKSSIILIDEKEKIDNFLIEKYVKFGELKEYNKRSGPSKRSPWWKLPKQAREGGEILFPRNYNTRLLAFYNPKKFVSNRFYRFKSLDHKKLIYKLNSTLNILMMEIYGKTNLGEGALELGKPEIRLLPILDLNIDFDKPTILEREALTIFEECGFNLEKPLREQEPKPLSDRKELDNIIFNELDLSEDDRKEVYWSVCELVKQRLEKAKSLSG